MKKSVLFVLGLMLVNSAAQAATITCGGDEPFWSIIIRNDQKVLKFNTPSDKNYILRILSLQKTQDGGYAIKTKYTSLNVEKKDCIDESGATNRYTGTFIDGNGITLEGCCTLR